MPAEGLPLSRRSGNPNSGYPLRPDQRIDASTPGHEHEFAPVPDAYEWSRRLLTGEVSPDELRARIAAERAALRKAEEAAALRNVSQGQLDETLRYEEAQKRLRAPKPYRRSPWQDER